MKDGLELGQQERGRLARVFLSKRRIPIAVTHSLCKASVLRVPPNLPGKGLGAGACRSSSYTNLVMDHRLGDLRDLASSFFRSATQYFLSRNCGNVVELSKTVKDTNNRQKTRCERQRKRRCHLLFAAPLH